MKTVVLGSGGWGTALSLVLHRNGHPVTLWSHVPEKAAYMERARENPDRGGGGGAGHHPGVLLL